VISKPTRTREHAHVHETFARHKGSGSIDEAANFTAPQILTPATLNALAYDRPHLSPSGGIAWFEGNLYLKVKDCVVLTNAVLYCALYSVESAVREMRVFHPPILERIDPGFPDRRGFLRSC
jgi:hypothetical protein